MPPADIVEQIFLEKRKEKKRKTAIQKPLFEIDR
jgi:hypothetical protein